MFSTQHSTDPILSVSDLTVVARHSGTDLEIIRSLSFSLAAGEILGCVGESGAGKSMAGAALSGLMPPSIRRTKGIIRLDGRRIDTLPERDLQKLRGKEIGYIFQDPLRSLNPMYRVGRQLVDTILQHLSISRTNAMQQALALLDEVGIPDAKNRFHAYPHELSGGLRQRVVIALALCANPKIIVADEATSALDVSLQARINKLLQALARDRGVGVLMITHDMGVVSEFTDKVLVLYSGRVAEYGSTKDIVRNPFHPYTSGLLSCVPRLDSYVPTLPQIDGSMPSLLSRPTGCAFHPRCPLAVDSCAEHTPSLIEVSDRFVDCPYYSSVKSTQRCITSSNAPRRVEPLELSSESAALKVENLGVVYRGNARLPFSRGSKNSVAAVDDVSFEIKEGRTFALVGESGSGKTTIARAVAGLQEASTGSIRVGGSEKDAQASAKKRSVQMIFQNPDSSLNPRWPVMRSIAESIRTSDMSLTSSELEQRIGYLLETVGLASIDMKKYPHEFSGGQRQRVCIARALASNPYLLICDEPTSALDVSVQSQVLQLLRNVQKEFKLTCLFITHDLGVVRQIADSVGVLSNGRMCEIGSVDQVFEKPRHKYTKSLLSAAPQINS